MGVFPVAATAVAGTMAVLLGLWSVRRHRAEVAEIKQAFAEARRGGARSAPGVWSANDFVVLHDDVDAVDRDDPFAALTALAPISWHSPPADREPIAWRPSSAPRADVA